MKSSSNPARRGDHADVAVLGCGLIGLACARAIARNGRSVALVGERKGGEASPAAAGILAPSLERGLGEAKQLALLSRDRYPAFVTQLADDTGITIALNRLGLLEVALEEDDAARLSAAPGPAAEWLDGCHLASLEPTLGHLPGARLHSSDGAVDNVSLLHALRVSAGRDPAIRTVDARALGVEPGGSSITVVTTDRRRLTADRVVVALGAWAHLLGGLPSRLPITPVRGQIVALASSPVRHVCVGAHQYLVPRAGAQTLAGSTMEAVGHRIGTTEEAVSALRAAATRICRALGAAREGARWSGLRPVTPDMLPILGADPEEPRVLYACGHSRNGVLLTPLTAELIAAEVNDSEKPVTVNTLGIGRFRRQITVKDGI